MTKSKPAKNVFQFERHEVLFLAFLVALSLALRLVYHAEMGGNVLVNHLQLDEQFHDQWARSIAEGDWIGSEVFFRAPLYPYAVASLYALAGHSPDLVRILQHLMGVGTVLLIYLLARQLAGTSAAMFASLLASLYAVMIYFEGRLLFDSLLSFLTVLWFVLVLLPAKATWLRYALIGLLYGLICVMRPTFIALAPFLFLTVFLLTLKGTDRALTSITSLVLAFLVPVVAVTLRNGIVGGDYVLVASQGGINFYIGNNPQADGMSSWVPELGDVWGQNREVDFVAEQAEGRNLLPSEVSSYWYGKGWAFLRHDPLGFISLQVRKAYLFWSRIEIANNLSYYWFERASVILRILPVGFWLVAPLGLAGAFFARKNKQALLLIIFLLLYWLVTSAFFVSDRFRLPIVPVLCVFAGLALHQIIAQAMARQWRRFLLSLLAVAAGALLVNTNLARIQPDRSGGDNAIRGRAALESGDLRLAAELLERAAEQDPDNSSVHINLGVARWGVGRMHDAADAFRAALRGNPYLAQVNLAHLFFNSQLLDSALIYAERSIAARPFAPGGYIITAKTLLVQGQVEKAENILVSGSDACKSDFLYGDYLLAGILFQKGSLERAGSLYRDVLVRTSHSRQPEYTVGTEKEQFGEDLTALNAKSRHAIGRVFAAYGQLDSSEVYFRTAAELLPMKPDIWADWGVCLLRLNRLEQADTVMRRAVNLTPRNPAVWFNFASLLARKGDLDGARRAAEQSLILKPDFVEAQTFLQTLRTYQDRRAAK